MSIKEVLNKPTIKIAVFIFLATLLAFGIGYLTGQDSSRAPIIIEKIAN